MKQVARWFLLLLTAVLLRFRYRVRYKGLDSVKELLKNGSSGCLFLPNHPAVLVDPLIVSLPLMKQFHIRPLIIEYMYYHPLFHWVVRLLDALAIPNFGSSFSPLKLKRAERALATISEGLKKGDRFLIYPSGTTKFQAKEVVGGAFGVHKLVAENPDIPIVLVRITGLWGSGFSRAPTNGGQPYTKQTLKNAPWIALKNFLFFIPKREVEVEFEVADKDFPRTASKQDFNRYLENWYNKPFGPDGEPLKLVSYAFWNKQFVEIEKPKNEINDLSHVPEEVKKRVAEKVAALAKVPQSQVLPDLTLIDNLGLDSLDHAELVSFLEEQFDVSGVAPEHLTTVGSLFLIASGGFKKEEAEETEWNMKGWNKVRSHTPLELTDGESILEVFLKTCDKNLFQIACTDPRAGPITYFRFKKGVLLLAKQIAKLKGKRIGILMPASPIAYMLVFACYMAKKAPVMINWTVGGKHLETVVEVSAIQHVISSWTFLDALENVDISLIEPLLVVLEELKADISLFSLLMANINALRPISAPEIDPESEAVVLFTSGTESMPKGVPLTHHNILFDLRAAVKRVNLYQDDKLLAMLPPFHSFGFSVTGLLPLLTGMAVCYYPNPTDSKRLAKAIERWEISVLCSAPTFLKNIMQFAKGVDLSHLRTIISGAEKAPDELFSAFSRYCPEALFVEGYGITECSPVLSANVSGDRSKGVGKALSGIQLRIVDPEKFDAAKEPNQVGLVLASGPSVFSGYLNKGLHDPFVDIAGTHWYQTGDLGMLDVEGNLILSGRLKRFIKIGGEMISLSSIEEALSIALDAKPDSFVVIPQGDLLGKVALVLFSTYDVEPQNINQLLRKGGISALVKIEKVIHLETIPQSATGKVAYRELNKMLTV